MNSECKKKGFKDFLDHQSSLVDSQKSQSSRSVSKSSLFFALSSRPVDWVARTVRQVSGGWAFRGARKADGKSGREGKTIG